MAWPQKVRADVKNRIQGRALAMGGVLIEDYLFEDCRLCGGRRRGLERLCGACRKTLRDRRDSPYAYLEPN